MKTVAIPFTSQDLDELMMLARTAEDAVPPLVQGYGIGHAKGRPTHHGVDRLKQLVRLGQEALSLEAQRAEMAALLRADVTPESMEQG